MASALSSPVVLFPADYDARSEEEASLRGYLNGVVIECADHKRYQLSFIDSTRLQQALQDAASSGRQHFAEPGLVVLAEVTTELIRQTVKQLWDEHFFEQLKPLAQFEQSLNAGNLGDIYKHACLIEFFKCLAGQETVPLTYLESHSGYAVYEHGVIEKKNGELRGERRWSLGPLLSQDWKNDGLETLKQIVLRKRLYPGSPALALWFLPRDAKLYFYDVNPLAIESIKRAAKTSQREVFACVHPSDALLTVQHELARSRDALAGRAVAFLDPWYRHVEEQRDWEAVMGAIKSARPENSAVIWYPKKLRRQPFPAQANYAQLRELGLEWAEIWFSDRSNVGKKRWSTHDLAGCGLAWKNARALSEIAARIGAEMQERFAQRSDNGRKLDLQFRRS